MSTVRRLQSKRFSKKKLDLLQIFYYRKITADKGLRELLPKSSCSEMQIKQANRPM